MGTTAEKLQRVLDNKSSIKQAIIDKGVAVADSDAFSAYAAKIGQISGGGGVLEPLTKPAGAEQILAGYQAYSDQEVKIEGTLTDTIPALAALSAIPQISNPGYYEQNAIKLTVQCQPDFRAALRLYWKKDAIPTLPIDAQTQTMELLNEDSQIVTVGNLDNNSSYGFWCISKSSDGVWQTTKSDNNRITVKTLDTVFPEMVEVPVPAALSATDVAYMFRSKSGDLFVAGADSISVGIYHYDFTAKAWTQAYDSGYQWQYWYEDSAGNVFVSSNVNVAACLGVLRWDGSTFSKVYSNYYTWRYWFEDSTGNVFVSSKVGYNTGILRWDGTAFNLAYSYEYEWYYWFEDNKGNVFVGGNHTGILKWEGTVFTKVFDIEYGWGNWYEDSLGNVFISGSRGYGILKWNGTAFTQVYGSGSNWIYWLEDSKGNLFVGGYSGILKWNGTVFSQVGSGEYWIYLFEDKAGNVFVSSYYHQYKGILKWNGESFAVVYDSGYEWQNWFEDSRGNVFVASNDKSNTGILRWNGTTFEKVYSDGYYWCYWFEDKAGNVFVGSFYTVAVLKWDGTTFDKVYNSFWRYYFEDSAGNVFMSSNNSSYPGILKWNGTAFTKVFPTGYNYKYFYEDTNTITFVSSNMNTPQVIWDKGTDSYTASETLYGGVKWGTSLLWVNSGTGTNTSSNLTQAYPLANPYTELKMFEGNKGLMYSTAKTRILVNQ